MRTSGKTNSPPGHPNLHKAGSGGGEKDIKRGAKTETWASLLLKFFDWPALTLSYNTGPSITLPFSVVRQNQGNYTLPRHYYLGMSIR